MNEWGSMARIVADFGVAGVMAIGMVLLYRLLDKFGGAFLAAQKDQAVAMAQQASATAQQASATTQQAAAVAEMVGMVKESQSDQREILIAVRVLADRSERQMKYLEQIESNCRATCRAA